MFRSESNLNWHVSRAISGDRLNDTAIRQECEPHNLGFQHQQRDTAFHLCTLDNLFQPKRMRYT
jgi:hypothetical protein